MSVAAGIADWEQVLQQILWVCSSLYLYVCVLLCTCLHVWPLCVSLCVHMATNVSMCAHKPECGTMCCCVCMVLQRNLISKDTVAQPAAVPSLHLLRWHVEDSQLWPERFTLCTSGGGHMIFLNSWFIEIYWWDVPVNKMMSPIW